MMYDEGPTERQIEDWNAHNDHTDSYYPYDYEEEAMPIQKRRPKRLPKFISFDQDYSHNYYSILKDRVRVSTNRHNNEYAFNLGRHEPKGWKLNLIVCWGSEWFQIKPHLYYQKHEAAPF